MMAAVHVVQIPLGALPEDSLRLASFPVAHFLHSLAGVLFGVLGPLQFARLNLERKFMKAALSLAVLAIPMMVNAADLRVTVTNGPPGPATLHIALFDTADSFSAGRAMMSQKVEMHDGVAQWVFSGVPEGVYAIKSFADENGNARLDTNFIGLPMERYGFSNDARGRMGPPTFDAAAVQVIADSSISFQLK
jgi:uncharacterized protein (DUF2141 family)